MFWLSTLSAAERAELDLSDPLLERPEVVVVGNGIVGLATGYFLASSGLRVQVIGRSLTTWAMDRTLGGIWPNYEALQQPDDPRLALAHRSRDLWARLAVRPEFRTDWRVTGVLDLTASGHAEAVRVAGDILEHGGSATGIDSGQMTHLEPALKPVALAGWHFPSEAHVNPLKAGLSFARAARKAGARVTQSIEILSGETSQGRLASLETSAGPIRPRHVVLAPVGIERSAHPWLPDFPVRRVASTFIASHPQPPLLRACLQSQQTILQLRTGEVVIRSDASPEAGQNVDPGETAQLLAAAQAFVSGLETASFPHAWRGVELVPATNWPVVGRAQHMSNALFALGGSCRELLLAPLVGQLLAESLREGALVDELQSLCPCPPHSSPSLPK